MRATATPSSPARCGRERYASDSWFSIDGGMARRHERRETTYLEMSRGLAESGIEKWTVDSSRMTMTFYDKAGTEMLVEQIS